MRGALDDIGALKERAANVGASGGRAYNGGWHEALDLEHMLTVAEATTLAALERQESRGGHTRDDFPGPTEAFGAVNIVARLGEGGVTVTQEPLPQMPAELAALFEED